MNMTVSTANMFFQTILTKNASEKINFYFLVQLKIYGDMFFDEHLKLNILLQSHFNYEYIEMINSENTTTYIYSVIRL